MHVAAKYVCVQLNWGEGDSLEAKWGLIVANLVLFHADMNKSVTELEENKESRWDWSWHTARYTHMVRGHEVQVVSVVGVEGHDVVDRFAGW